MTAAPVATAGVTLAPAVAEAVTAPPPAPEIPRGTVIGLAVAGIAAVVTGLYYWSIKR
jgi:uncharacterized membrane protein (DUF485 family)